ncbi:MAG TPA: NAD-dependent epimerase/dehydratase family protein [Actinomycetes bacterium]|nr:NAD-dependent epimerase/dehydratase family protein [Actinomycetes bacterium]
MRVVLVTGVSRYLGGRFARELASDPAVERVVGVDVVPPVDSLGAAEFVRADIRNPVIAKVIASADVDTVVHMNVIATPQSMGGRTLMKEVNVIGTMQLLAACQKASSVRKLVVKSSSTVYGASPKDPALFTEEMEPRALPRSGFAKDSVEVEGYVRGFSRRRPDVVVATLRFANCLGPGVRTPMSAYFELPVIPRILGFDPRLQFVHEDDMIECLRRCTLEDHPGTYNVAGDGVLTLSQAARRTGKPTVSMPGTLLSALGGFGRRTRLVDFSPEQMSFLTYGRGIDTRRMRDRVGFAPHWTTAATFAEFVRSRDMRGPLESERLEAIEDRVLDVLAGGRR